MQSTIRDAQDEQETEQLLQSAHASTDTEADSSTLAPNGVQAAPAVQRCRRQRQRWLEGDWPPLPSPISRPCKCSKDKSPLTRLSALCISSAGILFSGLALGLMALLLMLSPAARPTTQQADLQAIETAAVSQNYSDLAPLPVVLWHGMGDSCCATWSIGAVAAYLQEALPGVFVLSIATGLNTASDLMSGYFGNMNTEVDNVCRMLSTMPVMRNGYNAIGFSQGGQFMRAVVERCQHTGPPMRTLITLGGQHQGIMSVPSCINPSLGLPPTPSCARTQSFLGWLAYLPFVRTHSVQAQYFKDPYHMDSYLKHSIFLADINNEQPVKRQQYKDNLLSLEKLVLFRFSNDTMVVPRDSAWFGFWNGDRLQAMEETELYQEDWIGLKQLNEDGRLVLAEAPGMHMHFSLDPWFNEHIVQPYLTRKDL